MTDYVAGAARTAATALAPEFGRHLPVEVEAALAARAGDQRPDHYLNVVSLGSLTVSVATLAWTIYNDQRTRIQGQRLAADELVREVRSTLEDADMPLPAGTDRITEVVATEIIRQSTLTTVEP